jgi:1-phosphofructokinase family hexose kinase
MIVTVTLNPCVDHTLTIEDLKPNDTNRVRQVQIDAGGKGIKASRVITGLGGETVATGFLGGNTGAFVRHVLDRESVKHDFTAITGATRVNFEIEDYSGHPPTCFNEPGPSITVKETHRLVAKVRHHLKQASWFLAAGSKPPGLDPEFFSVLGTLARQRSIPFAVDADGDELRRALMAGPALIKPNVYEASRLLGRSLETTSEILDAALEIREQVLSYHPAIPPIVIISCGGDGAVLADEDGLWLGTPASIEVVCTVGSGDSMMAAMLTALDQGLSKRDAFRLGLAAGAATAQLSGGNVANRAQTEALLPKVRVEHAGVLHA